MTHVTTASGHDEALQALLSAFSIELTPGDDKSIDAASRLLPVGTETFIAGLRRVRVEQVVSAAVRLRQAGMTPVPHVAARNFATASELDSFLGRVSTAADVKRVLVIAGDRERPAGPYYGSLEILQSGLLEKHGINAVYLSCYPEEHPRIASSKLEQKRAEKLSAALESGLAVGFISQFCFDPAPILQMAKRLAAHAIAAPYRMGVAGPASRATLLKYAMMCGIGPSIRALRERSGLATSMLSGETPEQLLREVALARANDPTLRIAGVHFFTFGALANSAELIRRLTGGRSSTMCAIASATS
jgi:methylenetetrahydrofolate reductase (NADPH)